MWLQRSSSRPSTCCRFAHRSRRAWAVRYNGSHTDSVFLSVCYFVPPVVCTQCLHLPFCASLFLPGMGAATLERVRTAATCIVRAAPASPATPPQPPQLCIIRSTSPATTLDCRRLSLWPSSPHSLQRTRFNPASPESLITSECRNPTVLRSPHVCRGPEGPLLRLWIAPRSACWPNDRLPDPSSVRLRAPFKTHVGHILFFPPSVLFAHQLSVIFRNACWACLPSSVLFAPIICHIPVPLERLVLCIGLQRTFSSCFFFYTIKKLTKNVGRLTDACLILQQTHISAVLPAESPCCCFISAFLRNLMPPSHPSFVLPAQSPAVDSAV